MAIAIGIPLLILVVWGVSKASSGKPAARRKTDAPAALPGTVTRDPNPEVMAGGLQHMALADLLQFLAQGGHTGTLQITSGRRTGIVKIVQGLVIHAEYRRERDLEAMYQLLSLSIGDFRFKFESPPDEPVRGHEVVDILMLWLSRKEEQR
jgi:hypothetical protein